MYYKIRYPDGKYSEGGSHCFKGINGKLWQTRRGLSQHLSEWGRYKGTGALVEEYYPVLVRAYNPDLHKGKKQPTKEQIISALEDAIEDLKWQPNDTEKV